MAVVAPVVVAAAGRTETIETTEVVAIVEITAHIAATQALLLILMQNKYSFKGLCILIAGATANLSPLKIITDPSTLLVGEEEALGGRTRY